MGHFLITLLILSMAIVSFGIDLNVEFEWKLAEYQWDNWQQLETAIRDNNYQPKKCLLYDVTKADDGRIFITLPREMGPGTPATLVTVSNETCTRGPRLRPYPDWSCHNNTNCPCPGLISVYYTQIECDHLFVLDSGRNGTQQICNPKLVIFDLKTNKLVKRLYIPCDIAFNRTNSGVLTMPLVHIPGKCSQFLNEMIIFISDKEGNGLVVYDASRRVMCRVESDYMKPTNPVFTIANETLTYPAGIYGMTIIGDELFYAPLAATKIYKMKIKDVLKCPDKNTANNQTKLAGTLKSQTSLITSMEHVLFLNNIEDMTILGVDSSKQFNPEDMVELVRDPKKLQAISGMKYSRNTDELLMVTDRFQRLFLGTLDEKEINFYYMKMKVQSIRETTDLFYTTTTTTTPTTITTTTT
ncbi:PREDICTED: major royal jelly protein 3-like [Wasmannia auropunctata]|uniref:major royal jelly protein 3-like n=1 Tax=Wasmannia auropunctata TaxID=64793 RepID=UPI0005EE09CA|nr:PREDICTED: major royal jelly protein 3-like [Wasmannia auropunctata]